MINKIFVTAKTVASEVLENMRYRAENEVLVEVTKGAVNLTRDAVTGTVNLTRDAVTGTVNLTRDAVKCVSRNTKSILSSKSKSRKAAIMVGCLAAGLYFQSYIKEEASL